MWQGYREKSPVAKAARSYGVVYTALACESKHLQVWGQNFRRDVAAITGVMLYLRRAISYFWEEFPQATSLVPHQ
jgi:hypothetical protein